MVTWLQYTLPTLRMDSDENPVLLKDRQQLDLSHKTSAWSIKTASPYNGCCATTIANIRNSPIPQ